jgi:hypothetical protein
MTKLLTTSVALVTVFSSLAAPAFAASSKHRAAPVGNDTVQSYARNANEELLARPSDIVTSEGRIIGADPDASIRTELLRDRTQAGF